MPNRIKTEVSEGRFDNRAEFVDTIWKTLLIEGEAQVILKNGREVMVEVVEDSMDGAVPSGD